MTEKNGPAQAAEAAKEKAREVIRSAARKLEEAVEPPIPGRPGSAPPPLEEPTQPRPPLPPKPEQGAPEPHTPSGARLDVPPEAMAQQGEFLTTSTGLRLPETDHSLKAGPRGPILLQDHHLREKIMHFDHERIPERAVHARGAGAHGVFIGYGTAAPVTKAAFLAEGVQTPVFTRFSTVVGSRGSADAVRDTRGFATKFYTTEGNFDLVGNNIPVFFIQDAIKFPDIVHAAKPHPDREIPQAQSAHDTFWDFVSLHTEATHHVIWQMSDRGVPRSYRMMEGFGVHTFRLVNAEGETTLVKFHWKPRLGVHSLAWEEAQLVNGMDPDFHRRDLYDAIEAGAFPEWELGIQTFPDTPEQTFEGIDLLDPTKIVPEELAPVQPIGLLTLNATPRNFFAETEQVAFHPGHLVPGIDLTDDPLLHGRLFSYLDTQLNRFNSANFNQVPINRPHVGVNDMLRDGFMQQGVHVGAAPYRPNSLDGGCPFLAGELDGAGIERPVPVPGAERVRQAPESFGDHFTQPRMFWRSLSRLEQQHTMRAYAFELGRCYEETIRERALRTLAEIDPELCAGVAEALGLPAPEPTRPLPETAVSPALSQVGASWPVDGRLIGIVVAADTDPEPVRDVRAAVFAAGMTPLLIAEHGGQIAEGLSAQRSFLTARSIEFDALLLAGCPAPGPDAFTAFDARAGAGSDPELDPRVALLIQECFRHAKAIGGWAEGTRAIRAAGVPADAPGLVLGEDAAAVCEQVRDLLGTHRVWERLESSPA